MALVRFVGDKYTFYTNESIELFTESEKHRHDLLLDYASKNISHLPVLLEEYVSKSMDIETFKLKDYEYKSSDSDEIVGMLKALHPYYEDECKKVFINAIGDYFNTLLLQSAYKKGELANICEEDWYICRFKKMTYILWTSVNYPKIFYDKYKDMVGANDSDNFKKAGAHIGDAVGIDEENDERLIEARKIIEDADNKIREARKNISGTDKSKRSIDIFTEVDYRKLKDAQKIINEYDERCRADSTDNVTLLFLPAVKTPVRGFDNVIRTQERIKNMLLWILDRSEPNIGKLEISQRIWIYSNVFKDSQYEMGVRQKLLLSTPRRYDAVYDYKHDLKQAEHDLKRKDEQLKKTEQEMLKEERTLELAEQAMLRKELELKGTNYRKHTI